MRRPIMVRILQQRVALRYARREEDVEAEHAEDVRRPMSALKSGCNAGASKAAIKE